MEKQPIDEAQLRERFCAALKQLWSRGLIVGDDGMLCCEVHRRRYLAAPTGVRRADLTPGDLICVDIGGENVQGGEGIDTDLWQPHRDVYQTHLDESGGTLGASAIVEPTRVMALLAKQPGADRLELGATSIAVVDGRDAGSIRRALTDATEAILRGRGLFVAAANLPALLNRIERIDHEAAVRLAAGG